MSPFLPSSLLKAYSRESPIVANSFGPKTLLPNHCKTAFWLSEPTEVCVGATLSPFKNKVHAQRRTHTSPAFHAGLLRLLQTLSLPGKRNPIPVPPSSNNPPSDSERPGALPAYTCLSAGLTAKEGASSTFPCPSAVLTGAGSQGTRPHPIHAHQHI